MIFISLDYYSYFYFLSACSGTSVPGYCAGPYDLQCCISGTPSTDITIGYDFSSTLSSSSASCLKSSGAGYVIPRGYQSNCKVDTQVCTSIKNAYSAGMVSYIVITLMLGYDLLLIFFISSSLNMNPTSKN
jgi:hypothetical protein